MEILLTSWYLDEQKPFNGLPSKKQVEVNGADSFKFKIIYGKAMGGNI